MQAYVRKAIKTEAITALGTIRTAARVWHVENPDPYGDWGLSGMINNPFSFDIYKLSKEDYDGLYYENICYRMSRLSRMIWIEPTMSTGRPKSSMVNQSPGRITLYLDTGVITDTTQ